MPARLVAGVGDPAAVGGELALELVEIRLQEVGDLAVGQRQQLDVPLGLRIQHAHEQPAAVRRDARRILHAGGAHEPLVGSGAGGGFSVDVAASAAERQEEQPAVVRRPDGVVIVGRVERQARWHVAREVFDPEVARVSHREHGAPAVVRDPRIPEVALRTDRFELLPAPIEPGQLRLVAASAALLVGQDAVVGNREDRREETGVLLHVADDRKGLARKRQGLRVEGLRHERLLPHEEEVPGGVERLGPRVDDELGRLAVERSKIDRVQLAVGADAMARGLVEEPLPVRQEERIAVGRLPPRFVELRHRRGFSAGRGDAEDRLAKVRFEEDDAVLVPGAAPSVGGVAERQRRAARGLDGLQLRAREKPDVPAVGRPERVHRILRSGQRTRGEAVERSDPQEGLPGGVPRGERDLLAVGGEGRRAGAVANEVKSRLFGRQDGAAHDSR